MQPTGSAKLSGPSLCRKDARQSSTLGVSLKNPGEEKDKKTKGRHSWSHEERLWLWECFERSGGVYSGNYLKKVKDMWDGKDLSVRSQASLHSQLKQIPKTGLLSVLEREGIRKKVKREREGGDSEEEGNETGVEEVGREEGLEREAGEVAREVEVEDVREEEQVDFGVDEIEELSEEQTKVLTRLREVYQAGEWKVVPTLKTVDRRKVNDQVDLVKPLLSYLVRENVMDVTSVNRVINVGGFVVAERLGLVRKLGSGKSKKAQKPWWQRRLEGKIKEWRRDLGRVEEIRRKGKVGEAVRAALERRYELTEKGTLAVSTLLKGKIQSASTKIRQHVEKVLRLRQNNLFRNNQSQLYKELNGTKNGNSGTTETPNATESREFWSKIWSVKKEHNRDAVWLDAARGAFEHGGRQDDVVLSVDDVQMGIRKMANWKAPGPDGVRGFWFKKFDNLFGVIRDALQKCLDDGSVPEWMVKGRTVLIQKDPSKGTAVGNYRPIACLPMMWKLLTGVFAEKVYDHLLSNDLLPDEQKGCRKKSRGTKDQLLIDKAILREVRRKKRSLAMSWIDYKKAYDMVPHSWILEMLEMVKVARNISTLIRNSMEDWKTVLTTGGRELGEVSIERGIFQGDSFSPLLFIIIMMPLSALLKRENIGYELGNKGKLVNHLLFMDDLKLYGKTEGQLARALRIVDQYSKDICMEFGLEKCGALTMKRGEKVRREGISLPDGQVIKDLEEGSYKYLGILEGADIKNSEMKGKIKGEYLRRVKLLARSKLYSGNLIRGINAWAVAVVRYSAGIIEWKEDELKAMDVRTRKILTMHGVFHRSSSVKRLYMRREVGGRGLMSVVDCVRAEELGLREYVSASGEWMLGCVSETFEEGNEKSKEYKKRVEQERWDDLMNKKLHGKFWRDMQELDVDKRSWQWVKAGYLGKNLEGFICAAQEQALRTRCIRSTIDKENIDPKCRRCGQVSETVQHLASGCTALAQKEYRRRHDRMGLRVYWEVCRKYGVKCAGKWWEETPEEVRISKDGKFEIWWDKSVNTAEQLEHNRPDLVIINREKGLWTIVDFCVPVDKNVLKREQDKIDTYSPLAYQIRKMHKVKTRIVPVVIGSLGVVSKRLKGYIDELGIPDVIGGLQTSVLIGTSKVLRKVLNL